MGAGHKPIVTAPTSFGSTEPRDLRERFKDVINVKDFGAKGDGVTDDTQAISSAISAASNFNSRVFFPLGTYKISSYVDLTKDIFGDGYISDGSNSQPVSGQLDIYVSPNGNGAGISSSKPTNTK